MTTEQQATILFEYLDTDGSGMLEAAETGRFICGESAAPSMKQQLRSMQGRGEVIDVKALTRLLRMQQMGQNLSKPRGNVADRVMAARTGREKARCIFQILDADDSGYLELAELGRLLSTWGMPEDEAMATVEEVAHPGALLKIARGATNAVAGAAGAVTGALAGHQFAQHGEDTDTSVSPVTARTTSLPKA